MKACNKILIITAILFHSFIINASVFYVTIDGDDNNDGTSVENAFRTINRAFLEIHDGDEIIIGEGVFTISRTLEWDCSLTITGAGSDKTIIQASENPVLDKESVYTFSVFYNQKPEGCDNTLPVSLIQGVTIRNGAAPVKETIPTNVGGGLKNFADLTIKDCVLEDNAALNGGAIYNDGSLTLENSVIRNNHAFNLKGGVYNTEGATYTQTNSTFENNTEDFVSSGIYLISDFEDGFWADHGTNGNYEGGLVSGSDKFVIAENPDKTGINPSDSVGKFIRNRLGNWWAYAWFEFEEISIQETPKYLHMMIYKPVISKICVQVKNGHTPTDGNNTKEIVSTDQTKVNEWEDIVFEIKTTGLFSYIEIKPDFENAVTSERLEEDIDIYFDNIIISDSPKPRTLIEKKLASYPLPTGTPNVTPLEEIFKAEDVEEGVSFSNLLYEDILFDYNYANGFFRPYGWPDGDYNDARYVEFTVTPDSAVSVGINKIILRQKSNTIELGPQKLLVAVSTDSAKTFSSVATVELSRSSFSIDEVLVNNISSTGPVTFRFYGFESLLGTTVQKDLWIIDSIQVRGTVEYLTSDSVKTLNTTELTDSSVNVSGDVYSLGALISTEHGFCWNTAGEPTVNDSIIDLGEVISEGEFSAGLSGLMPNTSYYVRTFVKNEIAIRYGNELNFTTPKRVIQIEGSFSVFNKEYDGTSDATVEENNLSLDRIIEGDDVDLKEPTVQFTGTDAGENITVTIIDIELTGTDTARYNLSLENLPEANATIGKKDLAVSVADTSRFFGTPNPEFRLIFSGFIEGEDPSVLDEVPVATTEADETSVTGEYTISVSGGSDNNYSFVFYSGILTIESVTGISNPVNKIEVFPNPATDIVNIILDEDKPYTLEVFNLNGEKILTRMVRDEYFVLDISDQSPGVYFLKCSLEEKSMFFKVMKE
ncbi:MBG domain-containing protein [Saccharicrinis sp. FJH62]|uniref:MBG domain-containing protein n=1 Tax=Saccharicrinis sp. FJH62 TaxID=3344657 RepID=UPI0035D40777